MARAKDPKQQQKITALQPDPDFIPYVCHYNKNTILTKNGELLKVIRITGLSNDSMMSQLSSVRDNIRNAIQNHIKDNKFAFWFHTIRRCKDITPKGEFPDYFSQKINQAWVAKNAWNKQYVNEYYITIISEGLDTSITNMKAFLRSFSMTGTKKLYNTHLEASCKKLTKVVNNILTDIEEYGANLLGISEWDGVLYSQPMRFFGKIINLYEERYPLAFNDMSFDLASHKFAFGDREMEVVGHNNKNYASMISLKEYQEISNQSLDKLLQLPFEFIITQSFDFTFAPKEIDPYRYQDYILGLSEDDEFRHFLGTDKYGAKKAKNQEEPNLQYGKLQTTFMLIANNREQLISEVLEIMQRFSDFGMVAVREDIFAQHCFWAQLPANFRYLCRQKTILASQMAGFAALHSFPSGLISGNHWGSAVSVLKTVLDTPYFFNFHDNDLGHSLIIGPPDSGKAVFVNFMLAQARKFRNKIFYLDLDAKAKCFITAIGGHYYELSYDLDSGHVPHFNPLLLEKDALNKEFLIDWFESLVSFSKKPIPYQEIILIPQIIDLIYQHNISDFVSACEMFNHDETRNIYDRLKLWSNGKLSHIFGQNSQIDWTQDILAFDFTHIIEQKPVVIPIVNYLLHQFELSLDGSPAILVLSEAWNLINNAVFAPQMSEFLVRMRNKNCMVIFTSEDLENVESSEIIFDIKKHLATEIYLPNENPGYLYSKILGLNEEEMEIVQMIDSQKRHFLFKHRSDAIIASLDLSSLSKIRQILSSDHLAIAVMEETMHLFRNQHGKNPTPSQWIPQFVEVFNELEKQRQEEERKLAVQKVQEEKERLRRLAEE